MTENHRALRRLAAAAFWLALWQLAAMSVGQRILLASPVETLARLAVLARTADFWRSILFSLGHILAGYALAALAGTALAALAGRFKPVAELMSPLLAAMRSVPVASFVIAALIWVPSKRRQIDPKLSEMARVFRMTRWNRLRCVALPALLPSLSSALTVSMGLAWKSGVAAEVIGIPAGSIGEKLYKAKVYLATPDLFAWTLTIVIVSAACSRALKAALNIAQRALTREG